MKNYLTIASSIFALEAPWFPIGSMFNSYQGPDCYYLGQKPSKVIL